MLVAIGDDVGGNRAVQARDAREQGGGRHVHIDADSVDAAFHHAIERAGEGVLVDVVLVLADADRFRFDLHQLGQRILQAAGDGDGAAQADVEIGEFLRRQFGRGIDRRAGFRDGDAGEVQIRHLRQTAR